MTEFLKKYKAIIVVVIGILFSIYVINGINDHSIIPDHIHSIDDNMVNNLNQVIKKYPYFSSAHILVSKGLKNINSIRFNHKIKIAAAYSANRKILFNIISNKKIIL